jgi:hypothetical protein
MWLAPLAVAMAEVPEPGATPYDAAFEPPDDLAPALVDRRDLSRDLRKRWAVARKARLAGLLMTTAGVSGVAWGVHLLVIEPGFFRSFDGWMFVLGGGLWVAGGGALLAEGHIGEDRVLRGVHRSKLPGQLGGVLLGVSLLTALPVEKAALDGNSLWSGVWIGSCGVGLALEAVQMAVDGSPLPGISRWTLAPTAHGATFAVRW